MIKYLKKLMFSLIGRRTAYRMGQAHFGADA